MEQYKEIAELRKEIQDLDRSLGYYAYSFGGPDNRNGVNVFDKEKFASPEKEEKLVKRRVLVEQLNKIAINNTYQSLNSDAKYLMQFQGMTLTLPAIDVDDWDDDTWGDDATKEDILHMVKLASLDNMCIIEYPETCCD